MNERIVARIAELEAVRKEKIEHVIWIDGALAELRALLSPPPSQSTHNGQAAEPLPIAEEDT